MSSNDDRVSSEQKHGQQEEKIMICVDNASGLVQLLQCEGWTPRWGLFCQPCTDGCTPEGDALCHRLPASLLRLGRGGHLYRWEENGQTFGKGSAADPAGGKSNGPEQFRRIIVRCYDQQEDFD